MHEFKVWRVLSETSDSEPSGVKAELQSRVMASNLIQRKNKHTKMNGPQRHQTRGPN